MMTATRRKFSAGLLKRSRRFTLPAIVLILALTLNAPSAGHGGKEVKPQGTSLAQIWEAVKAQAMESYEAFRLAYQLQRRANDIEKQEVSTHDSKDTQQQQQVTECAERETI